MIAGPRLQVGFGLHPNKVVLVGQAPSLRSNPCEPCNGRFEQTFMELVGVDSERYRAVFDRCNLLARWPGPRPDGKGDAFPMVDARKAASRLITQLTGRKVILVGSLVSRAILEPLRYDHEPGWASQYNTWYAAPEWEGQVALIPHPSGRNRIMARGTLREQTAAFLRHTYITVWEGGWIPC